MTKDVHPIVKCTPVHTHREKEPCTSHHLNYMLRKYQSWNSQMSISTQWICLCSIEFYMVDGARTLFHDNTLCNMHFIVIYHLTWKFIGKTSFDVHRLYCCVCNLFHRTFYGRRKNKRIIFVFKFNLKVIDIIKNETVQEKFLLDFSNKSS